MKWNREHSAVDAKGRRYSCYKGLRSGTWRVIRDGQYILEASTLREAKEIAEAKAGRD